MKPASNTLVRFGDRSGDDRIVSFQEWLAKHPAGFYLNQKAKTKALLHTAHCLHYGDGDWSEASDTGMMNRTKICSENIRDLYQWAKDKGVTVQSCMDCAPDLQQELLDNYRRAGEETGYWGRRFLAEVKRKGGLATVKRMLKPSRSDTITGGWQELIDSNQMQLSVENSALKPEFRTLLTQAELAEAQRRLQLLPASLRTRTVPAEDVFPDEIPDDLEFTEGAKKRVVVNAYERNPKARAACIAKHGKRCSVCGMGFGERYGKFAKDIIHVHHKKPVAARREEYKINPTTDLAPVCPNCHAVLHLNNPPMGVQELKMIYERLNNAEKDDSI